MILLLENAQLSTDLDAKGFRILNLADLVPVPSTIIGSTDPRLSDARIPLANSVTDASVAPLAGIQQSKLNLNGVMPTAWLSTSASGAAQGNLAEYVSRKGQPNGYAGLDGTGKIPTTLLPATAGVGTVTSVGLIAAPQFTTGLPITTSGNLTLGFAAAPGPSWLGNAAGVSATPTFNAGPLPTSLIPSLDASKINSGLIALAQLPMAVGVGSTHTPGLVPDPGATGTATDYLARDMTYKPIPVIPTAYRPTIPTPTYLTSGNTTGPISVIPQSTILGVNWFGSTNGPLGPFTELPTTGAGPSGPYWTIPIGVTIFFYASRAGYNDSAVTSATNTNPS